MLSLTLSPGNRGQKWRKSAFFATFEPLLPIPEICIIRSPTIACLPPKISAESAHRRPNIGRSIRQPGPKTAKPSILADLLPVFQPLLPNISLHPDEIQIVRSHTLAHSQHIISAKLADRGPSNRPQRLVTRAKNGKNRQFVKNFYRFFGHCSRVPQRAPMKFASFVAIP